MYLIKNLVFKNHSAFSGEKSKITVPFRTEHFRPYPRVFVRQGRGDGVSNVRQPSRRNYTLLRHPVGHAVELKHRNWRYFENSIYT